MLFENVEWSISLLRHFKIQTLLKINCCMAAISAFRVTQHSQIFSLFFRSRIQCIALYQLYNSQALLNLRRGYYNCLLHLSKTSMQPWFHPHFRKPQKNLFTFLFVQQLMVFKYQLLNSFMPFSFLSQTVAPCNLFYKCRRSSYLYIYIYTSKRNGVLVNHSYRGIDSEKILKSEKGKHSM